MMNYNYDYSHIQGILLPELINSVNIILIFLPDLKWWKWNTDNVDLGDLGFVQETQLTRWVAIETASIALRPYHQSISRREQADISRAALGPRQCLAAILDTFKPRSGKLGILSLLSLPMAVGTPAEPLCFHDNLLSLSLPLSLSFSPHSSSTHFHFLHAPIPSLRSTQTKQEAGGVACDVIRVEVDESLTKEQLLETFMSCGK